MTERFDKICASVMITRALCDARVTSARGNGRMLLSETDAASITLATRIVAAATEARTAVHIAGDGFYVSRDLDSVK